ncbi:hypothetical protein S-PM2d098 [Synechococcus phage S-PM2]|uniref:Hypothetical-Protein / belonging to T4-LIKE GC: 836 n=1 Tax=Synechococcus phage S-PM2 TaxID=238854 RepID=Q5GQV5_BPSYP|nr:Hypothetical-Protein / belonging to T4-LIKE GC: 836 [Synechococcus phage S-PM2]CAF34162.1 Hypothetical-Protein / belonging to T4-LIKE GC: 836 [Synechococcus phage S-PM2]CFW42248.1 hypothetical protein S-PM2d098 [Synechococcus phage S-PM2]
MYSSYFILITILFLFAYAGYEETIKIVAYIDMQFRYALIKIQMKWMGWNLKRQLVKDTQNFDKFIEEYQNGNKDMS